MDTINLNKVDECIEEFWGQARYFSGPAKDRVEFIQTISFIFNKFNISTELGHKYYDLIRNHVENNSKTFALDSNSYVYRRNPIVKKQVDPPCSICGDIYAMPCAKHNNEFRCYQHN